MDLMKDTLKTKKRIARTAQKEWRKLLRRAELGPNDYFVLFPTEDRKCNYSGVRYLDTFLLRAGGNQAAILTVDSWVQQEACRYSRCVKSIDLCDRAKAGRLVTLYELYRFHPRFITVSLDQPFCRKASGLIGVKGTTVEELVAIGIYGIIPFRPLGRGGRIQ